MLAHDEDQHVRPVLAFSHPQDQNMSTAAACVFFTPFFLSPRDHRSFSGATLTCPGPSLCRGSQLPHGSHHLHPWGKHHFPWQALHYLPHLTWYKYFLQKQTFQEIKFVAFKLFLTIFFFLIRLFLSSWVLTHEQDAKHVIRT